MPWPGRLTLQERLTADIADAIQQHLKPHGVEVEVTARHACVACRGVRQPGVRVTTRTKRVAARNTSEWNNATGRALALRALCRPGTFGQVVDTR